ncbi:MAG: AtpZ/AtpI family protein [Oscillospiraceae bacterium]|nr:AtpZ/AtpI family protein [Oscillospiraceae bacterium]
MKDVSLLVMIGQLGLSVAIPLAGCIILAVWLRNKFSLGVWVIFIGAILGGILAISGFRSTLKTMENITTQDNDKDKKPPVTGFNSHD